MINFAHGDLMTAAAYAMAAATGAFATFGIAVVLAIAVGAAAAMATERVAFRPVRGTSLSTMLLTSYAVSVLAHVAFQNLISPRPLAAPIPSWLNAQIAVGGVSIGATQLVSIAVSTVVITLLVLLLRFSMLGIAMRAPTRDFAIARLMGIKSNRAILSAFAISGMLVGVAGVLWVAQRGSVDPFMGFQPVIKAFIATVMGGLGSLPGAARGGLLLGTVEVVLRSTLPDGSAAYRDAISLLIVIGILLVRLEGILASKKNQRQ